MEREELQGLFCKKIGLEAARFKRKMLRQEPEQIFSHAYQIDSMVTIYETLLEMSQEMGVDTLETLAVFPDLLAFLYGRWLKQEDSHMVELWRSVKTEITELEKHYPKAYATGMKDGSFVVLAREGKSIGRTA